MFTPSHQHAPRHENVSARLWRIPGGKNNKLHGLTRRHGDTEEEQKKLMKFSQWLCVSV